MSNPASKDALNELHALVAKVLAERLRIGDFTAADVNVARQFLKDNDIQALATPGSPLEGLRSVVEGLPFPNSGMTQ
jgi:hypothetical protein